MRIVLLNQFFWPDTVATAQLLADVAQALAREHKILAICAPAGEAQADAPTELDPNVSIIRTRGFRFSHRGFGRIASYAAYLVGTLWHGNRAPRPDVYVTLTTPPVLSAIGSVLASLRGARHVIWEMDVYPDIATDIGYFKRGGIADQITGALLDWSRRRATAIVALGEDMRQRLLGRGIAPHKIHVAENWADGREIYPSPIANGPLVIEYSGNLGLAHELETVVATMDRLRNHSGIRFIFSGGGPKRPQLEEMCRANGIRNVDFRPYCSRAELSERLGSTHIGLVTQLTRTCGSIVPCKIYGIMAAGRPLLYIGPQGSTPAQHISRFECGWHILPGDVDGLTRLLCRVNDNRHLIHQAGARARTAFEHHFDRTIGVERIVKIIGAAGQRSEQSFPKLSPSPIGD